MSPGNVTDVQIYKMRDHLSVLISLREGYGRKSSMGFSLSANHSLQDYFLAFVVAN